MLVAAAADMGNVIYRTLKLISLICCAFVILSFAMFARDQMAGASANQQSQLATGSNAPVAPTPTKPHAQPRRFIDGVAKDLTAPFDAVVQSNNAWVEHGLPAIFALLVYGLGLGYLARYSAGLSRRSVGSPSRGLSQ
jgi:hypothetical protein